jgi:prolyl-tRNA synthetase
MQRALFAASEARLRERTVDVATVSEALEAAQNGFARLPWAAVGEAGERELKTEAITVRCLQRPDGSIPDCDTEEGLIAIVARSY